MLSHIDLCGYTVSEKRRTGTLYDCTLFLRKVTLYQHWQNRQTAMIQEANQRADRVLANCLFHYLVWSTIKQLKNEKEL